MACYGPINVDITEGEMRVPYKIKICHIMIRADRSRLWRQVRAGKYRNPTPAQLSVTGLMQMGHEALELKDPCTNMSGSPVGFNFDDQLIVCTAMSECDPSIDLKVVRDPVLIFHRPYLNARHSTKQFLDSVHGKILLFPHSFDVFHLMMKLADTVKKSSDFIKLLLFTMR